MRTSINNLVEVDTDEDTINLFMRDTTDTQAGYRVRMTLEEAINLRDSLAAAIKLATPTFNTAAIRDALEDATHDEMLQDLEEYFKSIDATAKKGGN